MISSNYQRYLLEDNRIADTEWIHALRQAREEPDLHVLLERGRGAAWLESLGWDSRVLGISTARINAFFSSLPEWDTVDIEGLIAEVERQLRAKRVCLASCRIGFDNLALANGLGASGWQIRDVMNIYNAPEARSEPGAGFGEVIDMPAPQLGRHIDEFSDAFRLSRIRAEPRIAAPIAADFYRALCKRVAEDSSSIAVGIRSAGRIAGMALGSQDACLTSRIGRKIAYLWQIAVFDGFRGRGLSMPLLAGFMHRLREADVIEVGTQINNIAANRLYSRAGLQLMTTAITFHKWFD